jgi:hypothetical protein
MEPQHSSAVVAWLASHFPHAVMVIYEQVGAWAVYPKIQAVACAVPGLVYSLRVTAEYAPSGSMPELLTTAANTSRH